MKQPDEPFFLLPGLCKRVPLDISNQDLFDLISDRKLEITFEQARQRRDTVINSLAKFSKPARVVQFVQNRAPVFSS